MNLPFEMRTTFQFHCVSSSHQTTVPSFQTLLSQSGVLHRLLSVPKLMRRKIVRMEKKRKSKMMVKEKKRRRGRKKEQRKGGTNHRNERQREKNQRAQQKDVLPLILQS